MPAPPPPQSLDDLLAHAENFAGFSMRTRGKVPPSLFALSPAGPLLFIPATMASELEKDDFAYTARLICTVHDASAVVMVLEAWMTLAAPGRPLDLSVPPSRSPHRQEIVIITGETHRITKQKILPIIRAGSVFSAFGEHFGPPDVSLAGRFSHILPPKTISPAMRAKARSHLAVLGITPDAFRRDWSAN
jgi:hypothetical protein